MIIKENVSLKPYNTFGLDVSARYFVSIIGNEQIHELMKTDLWKNNVNMLLGAGSNVLFTKNFNGLVLKIDTKGIEVIHTNRYTVLVKVMAGETWESVVDYCVEKGYGGLENLTSIPGNAGSAPIQNIGAYGVEMKDYFESLEAIEKTTGEIKRFTGSECQFGYRDSVFKNDLNGKFIITSVTFKLIHSGYSPQIDYGSLREELNRMGIFKPDIKIVRNIIKGIRERKLPDPGQLGNAGSFFKNPVITLSKLNILKHKFPDIIFYPSGTNNVKIPAGWLIEKAGWKGYRKGDAGVYAHQALVLINYGNARGTEILALADSIKKSVSQIFDICLEREVNVID